MTIKPSFINIGPGRAGTSWLYQILEQHPDICMSRIKETEFFNTNYEKGLHWYEDHFKHCSNQRAIGEISNNYYLDKTVARKIKEYNPGMKLIINIRYIPNLLISYYNFGVRRGLPFKTLDNALSTPIGKIMGSGYIYRLKNGSLTVADKVTLLDSVLLFDRLSVFFDLFEKDNIYILLFEKMKMEPGKTVRELYDFLGVNNKFSPLIINKVVNASIQPKVRILAVFATKMAFFLRKARLYKILTTLHSSELLKNVLFEEKKGIEKQTWKNISYSAIEKIEDNMSRLIDFIPSLSFYWENVMKVPHDEY